MALETATYISDLVTTNPTASDPKSQGDDQIRLVKSCIKNTFPNITGALTPTHTELNFVDGVTSAIQTQIDTKGAIAGQTWTGAHTFPATVSFGNVSATEVSYLDGVTSAIQTQFTNITGTLIPAKGAIAGQTWTGTHDYTAANLTVATQAPGNNTNYAASTAFVIAQAFSSALPSQTGNAGKFITTDGTTASWASVSIGIVYSARTSNTILGTTDALKLIDVTSGTFTQTLTAAATLGSGWWLYYRNSGTGVVTIDPNGSELIDGVTSGTINPGMTILIQCTGTAFNVVRVGGNAKIEVLTSGTSWTCPLGVRRPKARLVGAGAGCGAATNYAGAGGGYCEGFFDTVPGTAYTYAIGAGTAGASGGSTTLAGIFTAPGGVYGSNPTAQTAPTGGSINVSGQQPVYIGGGSTTYAGGNSPLGSGASCGVAGNVAANGFGSGAAHQTTATAGQPGVIVLEY
jgi:hypothetical protein